MMAIGVPVVEDKIDAWKAWMTEECLGSRKEEFEQFNERMGLTTHRGGFRKGRMGRWPSWCSRDPGEDVLAEAGDLNTAV